jgi:hypothetical protein
MNTSVNEIGSFFARDDIIAISLQSTSWIIGFPVSSISSTIWDRTKPSASYLSPSVTSRCPTMTVSNASSGRSAMLRTLLLAVVLVLQSDEWIGYSGDASCSFVVEALSAVTPRSNAEDHLINRRQILRQSSSAAAAAVGAGLILPSNVLAESSTTTTSVSPIATLSDGSKFPLASFGLQIYDDNTAYKLTLTALECGYRNFFASVLAGNQKGFAKAVKDSGIPRSELYICGSVVSNRVSGLEAAKKETTKGWKRNMEAFAAGDIDYLDQIMLDYPGVLAMVWHCGSSCCVLGFFATCSPSVPLNRTRL